MNLHKSDFGIDFSDNKKALDKISIIRSKGLKNEIAGFITKFIKREIREQKEKEEREKQFNQQMSEEQTNNTSETSQISGEITADTPIDEQNPDKSTEIPSSNDSQETAN